MKQKLKKFKGIKVAVDMVIFTIKDDALNVLLIKRNNPPFKNDWALPGGHVELNEPLERAAKRELWEETGVKDAYLEQLYAFGDPKRDPRGRMVSIAYFALVPYSQICKQKRVLYEKEIKEVALFDVKKLPTLAFDHKEILARAIKRLQTRLRRANIVYGLLPQHFTLSEIREIYEIILGREIDKRNFRRKILSLGILKKIAGYKKRGAHRSANLYKFKQRKLTFVNIF